MTLNGIDVSNFQGAAFDWESYRGRIAFAGVKVSEGISYADPDAARNIAGARSIGAVVIGYHFLHAGLPGSQQAEWFLAKAHEAGLRPGDLIAVDCEDAGLGGETTGQMNAAAAAFTADLQRHFPGYRPVVYTEISMAPSLVSLGGCPLWLADLSVPLMAAVGPWELVSFWQTGQRGVDVDVFNGDAGMLAKLAIPLPAPPPPAPPQPSPSVAQARAYIAQAQQALDGLAKLIG